MNAESSPPSPCLAEAKRVLRARARAGRREAAGDVGGRAGGDVATRFLAHIPIEVGTAVSGYWPMRYELDPRPLLETLHRRGHACGLPVTVAPRRPLAFRAWRPGLSLEPGDFGTSVPPAESPEITPGLLLVPLLAFDAAGHRLGYGGGFYDLTLAALRRAEPATCAVGLAYAAQEVEGVPSGAGDERLDWIVTEREARRFA